MNSRRTNMNQTSNATPARPTYRDVAHRIITSKMDMRRTDLEPYFPELTARQLSKALENACNQSLIHSVARGLYRAGAKPTKQAMELESKPEAVQDEVGVTRNALVTPIDAFDTNRMIDLALDNLSVIERAWFSVVGGRSRNGGFGRFSAA